MIKNKKLKSILTGILVFFLSVGAVYAICMVWSGTTSRTVTEALKVGWVQPFPSEVLPNETHDVIISIINSEGKTSSPTQNVTVYVTRIGLEDLGVKVDGIGWGYLNGDVFTMGPDKEKYVTARVKIPGGYDPADGNVEVQFEVNRVD